MLETAYLLQIIKFYDRKKIAEVFGFEQITEIQFYDFFRNMAVYLELELQELKNVGK